MHEPDMYTIMYHLEDLLHGRGDHLDSDLLPGAELAVFDGNDEVFRAALARHACLDPHQPNTIWIRPIPPPRSEPVTGLPAFVPDLVRRRALDIAQARSQPGRLELRLATGQGALVLPARGSRLSALQAFDTWMITVPAETRAELVRLEHD